jgi:alpha-mannosidase
MRALFMQLRQLRVLLLVLAVGLMTAIVPCAEAQTFLSGYAKDVRGEIARHESPHPDARSVLVAHADPTTNVIEWESAAVPETATGPIKFALVFGMSGVDRPEDRWQWDLFVGDTKAATIENIGRSVLGGRVAGTADVASNAVRPYAEWNLFWLDRNGNAFGHLYVTVPPSLYAPGRAVRMRIEGVAPKASTSTPSTNAPVTVPDAWLMVFRYETRQRASVRAEPALVRAGGGLMQQLRVDIAHYGKQQGVTVDIAASQTAFVVEPGYNTLRPTLPVVSAPTRVPVKVTVAGQVLFDDVVPVDPVKPVSIYLLHHSHLDIGYTHVQRDVSKMQAQNLDLALRLAEQTRDYPADAQFRWNVEGFWSVEAFLDHATPEQRAALLQAVKQRRIEIGPLYGNMLTGLAQPEELIRMTDEARRFAREAGVPLTSGWISDVPGYSWGVVPALAHSGIKYFSLGTNTGDRIGHIIERLGDRPFYWRSASGQEKLLCWLHATGYSYFHIGLTYARRTNLLTEDRLFNYLRAVQTADRPSYDLLPLRYNIGSDNGPPDEQLSDLVRQWNAMYASPRLVISTMTEFFEAFEKRYGETLPVYDGELTPYWEDGAYSTARESMTNQAASARLEQAETFWALRTLPRGWASMPDIPDAFPADRFREAWRSVLLFNEHTWGSWNSITAPESEFTKSQWATKAAFAMEAERRSNELLDQALAGPMVGCDSIDVLNSLSWPRTDLVTVTAAEFGASVALAGRVIDDRGREVPWQRLSNGDLVFLASDVPAFGSKGFTLLPADSVLPRHTDGEGASPTAHGRSEVRADVARATLTGGGFHIDLDPATGAIRTLADERGTPVLSGASASGGLNRYIYQTGRQPDESHEESPSNVRITVGENGPLVASLIAESVAPGTNLLRQEVRLIAGVPRVEIINTIDKRNVYDPESAYFAFPFGISDPKTRVGVVHGFYRPERQQLPGSNKNYFTMRNWLDVSNSERGVALVSPDALMVEIGRLTTDANRVGWLEHVNDSASIFSYAMNNFWGTNYKAGQDGLATFRYHILPHAHARFDSARAYKAGREAAHPLVVRYAGAGGMLRAPFTLRNRGIVVSAMKPADDGKGIIVRLFNASERTERPVLLGVKPGMRFVDRDDRPARRVTTLPALPPAGVLTVYLTKR